MPTVLLACDRMRKGASLVLVGTTTLLVVGLALAPDSAFAYQRALSAHGAKLRWAFPSLRVWVASLPDDVSPDAATNAASAALSTWSTVECSRLSFLEDPRAQIVVRAVDASSWPHPPTLAAHTHVESDADTGRLHSAEILLNRAFRFSTSGAEGSLDLESILAHELGHALGLAHSRKRDALMRAGIKPGEVRRALERDDRDAVCALFPRATASAPAP